MVQKGRNGGTWNGPGIITSQSTALAAQFPHHARRRFCRRHQAHQRRTDCELRRADRHPTDTLVMYTYAGDANLDGKVDADDYFQIDTNYNKSGPPRSGPRSASTRATSTTTARSTATITSSSTPAYANQSLARDRPGGSVDRCRRLPSPVSRPSPNPRASPCSFSCRPDRPPPPSAK